MYIPNHFKLEDKKQMVSVIRTNSFGQLVTCFQNNLMINSLPFWLNEKEDYLYCHLARANPHVNILEKADDLKVIFNGVDAYISPQWYGDKNAVPTWNYETVQVSGKAEQLSDENLLQLLVDLSSQHEAKFETPWTIDKMDAERLEKMLKAIVGFKISIDSMSGKSKMSQNKSSQVQSNLIEGLERQGDYQSKAVSEKMKSNLEK